jgi:hypothetical protein
MEGIQQNGTEPDKEEQKYMSVEEYRHMMAKVHHTQMIQSIQLKQEKRKQSTEKLFQAFFYIPIRIYNAMFCTHSAGVHT